jgi:hypothetical protein
MFLCFTRKTLVSANLRPKGNDVSQSIQWRFNFSDVFQTESSNLIAQSLLLSPLHPRNVLYLRTDTKHSALRARSLGVAYETSREVQQDKCLMIGTCVKSVRADPERTVVAVPRYHYSMYRNIKLITYFYHFRHFS